MCCLHHARREFGDHRRHFLHINIERMGMMKYAKYQKKNQIIGNDNNNNNSLNTNAIFE